MNMYRKLRTLRFILAGALIGLTLVAPAFGYVGLEGSVQEFAGAAVGGAGVFAAKLCHLF